MNSISSMTEVMPDVQSSTDLRKIPITRVGISKVKQPMLIETADGKAIPTVAKWALSVALPATEKGTHMSRFVNLLSEYCEANMNPQRFKQMAQDMLPLLQATEGTLQVEFSYFINKHAPVSGVASLMDYQVRWEADVKADCVSLQVTVVVPVMSLCPCSKVISEYGAHNQRSYVTVTLLSEQDYELDELIPMIEREGSCQLWGLLKRTDEKYVTEYSYNHPKFAEDLVRDVAIQIKKLPALKYYRIEVENFESIHNHSAYAMIEGS